MGRPTKYTSADDLLNNCTVKDDCYIWPISSTPMPMLSPNAPMAKQFGTTSVIRILFTICRFVPAGPRLVHRCANAFCVNPFHFSESKAVRAKRLKLDNPNGLLPEQEDTRHLVAPPDEVLLSLRPKNPVHIKMLLDSAVLAGYDAQGMSETRSYKVPVRTPLRYADPDKPLLVIKPRPVEPPVMTDDDWDVLAPDVQRVAVHTTPAKIHTTPGAAAGTGDTMTVPQEAGDADTDEDDIFAMIRKRREALLRQNVEGA